MTLRLTAARSNQLSYGTKEITGIEPVTTRTAIERSTAELYLRSTDKSVDFTTHTEGENSKEFLGVTGNRTQVTGVGNQYVATTNHNPNISRPGIEPGLKDLQSSVLPLHHQEINTATRIRTRTRHHNH